ncbi:hypothetical protein RGQ29_011318 [Quercus rubra]|uniref:Uncharacterized protein n=1 Tax=Quercus rubra TaxID=3512 RepID=A0AAN7FXG9_QUERU|nr:hypothetical protein RGQ29_011318 [Quercus rubra]
MGSEHDDSEGRSDSIVAGQRRTRRQKITTAVLAPGEKRYNLRRPKTKATVTAARVMPELSKENKEETDVVRATDEKILRSKAAPALSTGAASENGGSSHFLRSKRVADSQVGIADITNNLVENTIMSEEVNETPEEYGDVDEYRSESHGEDANVDGEDEEDGEESEHPGEVSIGKKLWTFFTT